MKRIVMYVVVLAAIVTPRAGSAQVATPQTNTVAIGGDVGFLAPDGGSGESPHLQSAVGTVDGFVEYYYHDRVSLRGMYAWSRSQLAQVPGNSLQRQHLTAHVIYSWPLGRFRPFALAGGGAYFLNTNDHPEGPGRSVIKPGGSVGWGVEFYLRTFALRSEMNVHVLNDEIQFPELGGNTLTAFAWTFGIKVPF